MVFIRGSSVAYFRAFNSRIICVDVFGANKNKKTKPSVIYDFDFGWFRYVGRAGGVSE